ncbi:glycolate oxidase subunit GlcE [Salinicola aestuarinus]|uniref:glycolate oxidase subunit GlcE n=1 Tax=Salinicola aestuarinus TaxID=1949082 RepID=UPI000DA146AC|nr:glycolate oxidase subunit GlcE [Salinicola aestuarinus]
MAHLQDRRPAFTEPTEPGPTKDDGQDDSAALIDTVTQAGRERTPLRIVGGDTKAFLGRRVDATKTLDLNRHAGIVHYDPVELIATARAGTRLAHLEQVLGESQQRLAFEPPHFGGGATVGGMVAAGLSGPRRPWAGSVRDFVLGVRVITAEGKHLRFGGEVMKNVAGYDLSRLMVGAQGTLGVMTEVSFKVLPAPVANAWLRLSLSFEDARQRLIEWSRLPLPITGAAFEAGTLHLRLEGGEGSVESTRRQIGGDAESADFWNDLREHQLPFFHHDDPRPLWRLSLPARARLPALDGDWLIDWGGVQPWLRSDESPTHIQEATAAIGGHATRYTPSDDNVSPHPPLTAVLDKYHRRLKARLDPNGLFNPGRLYADW